MRTKTRNALGIGLVALASAGGLAWLATNRRAPDAGHHALDAVPNGALLVAVADLDALRASPVGKPLLDKGRQIPGLGKVSDVCGYDPLDTIHEIAIAIPAAGDTGDFGLVGAGDIDGDALIACASKVIVARGGTAVTTAVGTFRSVRDTSLEGGGGEIAVRSGDLVLLGGGIYLRAMIDAADQRAPTIRSSVAHTKLADALGPTDVRVTAVLTPDQRATLAAELASEAEGDGPAPGASISAAALGVRLGASVEATGVVLCDDPGACAKLTVALTKARDARAADYATRLIGVGVLLEALTIEARGASVFAHLTAPAKETTDVLLRVLELRGFRHPLPGDDPNRRPAAPADPGSPAAGGAMPAPPAHAPGGAMPAPPAHAPGGAMPAPSAHP